MAEPIGQDATKGAPMAKSDPADYYPGPLSLSVGVEDVADLIADLESTLN